MTEAPDAFEALINLLSKVAIDRRLYVLDADGNAVLEPDRDAWIEWLKVDKRRMMKSDQFAGETKDLIVSTMFIGIAFDATDPPILWQTLAQSPDGDRMWRYRSQAAAIEGHDTVVRCGKMIATLFPRWLATRNLMLGVKRGLEDEMKRLCA